MTVREVVRKETAPISATMPVQRAKPPLRSVSTPAAIRKAAKPIAATRKGPAEAVVTALLTTGFAFGTLGTRGGERDERHGHSDDAGQGTRERRGRVVRSREPGTPRSRPRSESP